MSRQASNTVKKPLHVMKFGGTSVGDAASIQKVVEIIRGSARENDLVVVVSAMAGVTNQLFEAAQQAEAGHRDSVEKIFAELRERHRVAITALIDAGPDRVRVSSEVKKILQEGAGLCQDTALLGELTLRARDAISSLGERLSAPMVAAALAQCGIASVAIEATELIQTDSCHGSADPRMDATGQSCQARLLPLLQNGIVPVVTGFIGATVEGVLTTLGRGGSDYSATILGASLDADEVTIWTDVHGLMTADPRLVPGAVTISEISYREAAELAYFGAKVLHPKTLSPVTDSGIPLWIRNTFAPEGLGTRITPSGAATNGEVKGLTAMSEVALITLCGSGNAGVRDVFRRAFSATAALRASQLLTAQASAQDDLCLLVPSSVAESALEALRREFEQDLADSRLAHITLDPTLAVVTLVGKNVHGTATIGRTLAALDRENLDVIAISPRTSECSLSLVVSKQDVKAALAAIHGEFRLSATGTGALPMKSVTDRSAAWYFESTQQTASAD
jgi:bifunctional aspartokinase / homoserine dehydrogenase 1